jgi:hypothetical protein
MRTNFTIPATSIQFQIIATDLAGNTTTALSNTLPIDTNAPVVGMITRPLG